MKEILIVWCVVFVCVRVCTCVSWWLSQRPRRARLLGAAALQKQTLEKIGKDPHVWSTTPRPGSISHDPLLASNM